MLLSPIMDTKPKHPLVHFREETKLSRAELARLANTTRQTIHRIEAFEQTPSLDLVGRFVQVAKDQGQTLRADDFLPMMDGAA